MPVRIIIADPFELIFEGVRCWLENRSDVKVTAHAATGDALLDLLRKEECDLVLLEVSLPGRDGIDTMRAVHKEFPKVKVLAHSALTDIEYVNSMLIEGAAGYLVKGTSRDEMMHAIATVMSGGRHISNDAAANVEKGYKYTDKRMDGEYIGLTLREREIIRLVALERTNEEIGALLHVSPETVKTHRKRIMTKLNVRSTAGLVKYALDRRWI